MAENDLAIGGLADARLAYAQRAFDGGDLALAEAQPSLCLVVYGGVLLGIIAGYSDCQIAARGAARRVGNFVLCFLPSSFLWWVSSPACPLPYLGDGARSRLAVASSIARNANAQLEQSNQQLDRVNA